MCLMFLSCYFIFLNNFVYLVIVSSLTEALLFCSLYREALFYFFGFCLPFVL